MRSLLLIGAAALSLVSCAPTTLETTTDEITTEATTTLSPQDEHRFLSAGNRTFRGFERPSELKWKENFTFVQAADTQFGLIDFMKTKQQEDWSEEQNSLALAVKEWNELNPKFVAICGDLVNAFPNFVANRSRQLESLTSELRKLNENIPLVLMPGNHDVLDNPNDESIAEYKRQFGDDYYSFWVDNVKFIVLNSQYFMNRSESDNSYKKEVSWLDAELADAKTSNYSHVIVLQHVPWFLHNIDYEGDDWAKIRREEALPVLNKLNDAGVRYVFSGHYHNNAEGSYKNVNMIITSAIGYQGNPNIHAGYRVVHVNEHDIQHEYRTIAPKKDPEVKTNGVLGSAPTAIALIFSIFSSLFRFYSV